MWYIIRPIIFSVWIIIKLVCIVLVFVVINIFSFILFFKYVKYESLEIGLPNMMITPPKAFYYGMNADKNIKETFIRDLNNWFTKKEK